MKLDDSGVVSEAKLRAHVASRTPTTPALRPRQTQPRLNLPVSRLSYSETERQSTLHSSLQRTLRSPQPPTKQPRLSAPVYNSDPAPIWSPGYTTVDTPPVAPRAVEPGDPVCCSDPPLYDPSHRCAGRAGPASAFCRGRWRGPRGRVDGAVGSRGRRRGARRRRGRGGLAGPSREGRRGRIVGWWWWFPELWRFAVVELRIWRLRRGSVVVARVLGTVSDRDRNRTFPGTSGALE